MGNKQNLEKRLTSVKYYINKVFRLLPEEPFVALLAALRRGGRAGRSGGVYSR
jgi:hypothetical protein